MGRIRMKGKIEWWLWGIENIFLMIGKRRREEVEWRWMWKYIKGKNRDRIIKKGKK